MADMRAASRLQCICDIDDVPPLDEVRWKHAFSPYEKKDSSDLHSKYTQQSCATEEKVTFKSS